MLRATRLKPMGSFNEPPFDSIVLDYEARHRRRILLETTRGTAFLLDLPETVLLRNGDALLLDDGRLVEVVAAAEPLIEIRCKDPQHLARLAWHLGNRHLPVEILANRLRIRRDHVIESMVKQLGGSLREIEAPFTPESGAYHAYSSKIEAHARHAHEHHAHEHHAHDHEHVHHPHDHAHDH